MDHVPDPSAFKSGRELAAWIGLVPRQHSSGGKQRLGRVSKQGDRYLRRLLTIGAITDFPGKASLLSLVEQTRRWQRDRIAIL
jgi:transposase